MNLFIFALIISGFILFFTYLLINYIRKDINTTGYATEDQPGSSDETDAAIEHKDNSKIGLNQVNEALAKMALESSKYTINAIVGVNRGGILTGAYLADSLKIEDDKLLRCSVPRIKHSTKTDKSEITIYNKRLEEINALQGTILIVDDVCRTGRTIKLAKQYIKDHFPKTSVVTMAIVANRDVLTSDHDEKYIPDFVPHKVDGIGARMPWHDADAEKYIIDAEKIESELKHTSIRLEEKRKQAYSSVEDLSTASIIDMLETYNIKRPKAA